MADDFRTCVRAGCRWPAAASLSYRYATRQVWLGDLLEERDPNAWDLCPHHADTLRVMRGWVLIDERVVVPAVVEPAAPDRVPTLVRAPARRGVLVPAGGVASGPSGQGASASALAPAPAVGPAPELRPAPEVGAAPAAPAAPPTPVARPRRVLRPVRSPDRAGRTDRYAALTAELPRLAAEVVSTLPHDDDDDDGVGEQATPAEDLVAETPAPAVRGARRPDPGPRAVRPPASTWDHVDDDDARPVPAEADGQLTLPRMVEESVVVPFLRPGSREVTARQ